jgi:oligoribonuclease
MEKPMKRTAKYLWLDVETTGLDPKVDKILEVAWGITGPDLAWLELDPDPSGNVVRSFVFARDFDKLPQMDEYVLNMHTMNGLFAACTKAPVVNDETGIFRRLMYDIERFEWVSKKPIIAGMSVHFDRGFLATHWPETFKPLEKALSHQHFDVSTLKMMLADIVGAPFPKAETDHRAATDVYQAVREALTIRQKVGRNLEATTKLLEEVLGQ